jgi:hypothetical protein
MRKQRKMLFKDGLLMTLVKIAEGSVKHAKLICRLTVKKVFSDKRHVSVFRLHVTGMNVFTTDFQK